MNQLYKKHNSFSNIKILKNDNHIDVTKIVNSLKVEINNEKKIVKKDIFEKIVKDLSDINHNTKSKFKI